MTTTTATTEAIINALETEGCSVKRWTGRNGTERLYIRHGGRDLGYISEGDDGTTGTCRGITRRAGWVASIIRNA